MSSLTSTARIQRRADARIRTADPFITSETDRSGEACRQVAPSGRLAGRTWGSYDASPLTPIGGFLAFGHGLGIRFTLCARAPRGVAVIPQCAECGEVWLRPLIVASESRRPV